MSSKDEITKYLIAEGFQATENGLFVNMINGQPYVINYNYRHSVWVLDTAGRNSQTNSVKAVERFISGTL